MNQSRPNADPLVHPTYGKHVERVAYLFSQTYAEVYRIFPSLFPGIFSDIFHKKFVFE